MGACMRASGTWANSMGVVPTKMPTAFRSMALGRKEREKVPGIASLAAVAGVPLVPIYDHYITRKNEYYVK